MEGCKGENQIMPHIMPPAILVVGQHEHGRQRAAENLERAGFRAIQCEPDAEKLDETLREEEVQLIVTVGAAEATGRSLLRSLSGAHAWDGIPIFHLTDGSNPSEEQVANIRALLRVRRAEEEARVRLDDMIHLHEISTRLSGSLELQSTLYEVVAAVMELQQAPIGVLMLHDEARHALAPAISIGVSQSVLDRFNPMPLGSGASGRAVTERRSIVIENVFEESAYESLIGAAYEAGYHAVYSVPLLTHKGEALGALTTCWRTPHRPTDWEIRLVELYARHAANAIENAQLYRQLREEDSHKDEFLAMLAHELRNPLAPIMNAAHVMRIHAPSDDTLLWAIGMVERQTRHLTHLVDDLLDVSRITRGKIELQHELVTLRSVMQNVAESSRPYMQERSHEFIIEPPEENLWLDADPIRLEQILNNLLHNAAKYTPRGGRITFNARREEPGKDFPAGAALIRVRDTGIGIAPEMLRRVFDVFSQAERTLDRAEGGLGLGLTLVRRLTEMHGGKVEAHSDGLGHGSEFVLRLPLAPISADTFEGRPHPEHADDIDSLYQGGHAHGRRVLVVDDQTDTAQSLAELLEIWGHEVRVGYDGPSAVELALEFNPDVVLLDIGLPLMNGYEVARRLREMTGQELMLVAMTGYGQEEDRRRALEAGFDLHMTKPVDLATLRDLINSASAI